MRHQDFGSFSCRYVQFDRRYYALTDVLRGVGSSNPRVQLKRLLSYINPAVRDTLKSVPAPGGPMLVGNRTAIIEVLGMFGLRGTPETAARVHRFVSLHL